MTKLEELKCVLEAIKTVRTRWIEKIEKAMTEMDDGKKTSKELFSAAISNSEAHEAHMNLVTLYGVIGNEVDTYVAAIEPHLQDAEVIPLPKRKVA
jgi:hypothetical protein